MFGSIALFALMTFIIWGWIFLWPILSIDNFKYDRLKGCLLFVLCWLMFLSLFTSIKLTSGGVPLTAADLKAGFIAYYGQPEQLYVLIAMSFGIVVMTIIGYIKDVRKLREGKRLEVVSLWDWGTYCFCGGITAIVVGVILWFGSKAIYLYALKGWLFPLFQTLFL